MAKPWPLWKKLTLAAIIAFTVVAIALSVGLGVGLTRNHSSSSSSTPDNSSSTHANTTRTSTWHPPVNASWQILLRSALDPASVTTPPVPIWDIDLYENPPSTMQLLHQADAHVICYFSAGSYEDWRADKSQFPSSDMGADLDGWPGERWIRISSPSIRTIMANRIKEASERGCDAIDPDNVDGYLADNGLGLTKADSINYVKFLAAEAAKYNMSVGLKNAGEIIPDVVDHVDFSVNEQCVQMEECETFAPFIARGKPVFNIEYPDGAPGVATGRVSEICSHAGVAEGSAGFSQVMKKMNLDGWVRYCDGTSYTTSTKAS
jgi:hypothetical protein